MNETDFSRAYIFTGGDLGQWALEYIRPSDYLIGADRGADFLVRGGAPLHLALGDFDSVTPEEKLGIERHAGTTFSYDPLDKDWTDTELAYKEAAKRGFREIAIAGALGTRFDHSLANVHLLKLAHDNGRELTLLGERNRISLCSGRTVLEADDRFDYVSLLPLTETVTGITLRGFRYPLYDATIRLGMSLGVSNVLEQPTGAITIESGLLLVIRSRD